MVYKIWDNKFNYYCLTLHTRKQAEIMVRHFTEQDFKFEENMPGRYRIDEISV